MSTTVGEFNRMDDGQSSQGIIFSNKNSGQVQKLVFGIIGVTLLLALLSIIVSFVAVGIAKSNKGFPPSAVPALIKLGQGQQHPNVMPAADGTSTKIWTIATGHDWGAHEYLDEDSGTLKGFMRDLIPAVCTEAKIICRMIWDSYTNCWDSTAGKHPRGGPGLLGRWYDACAGWYNTKARRYVYEFSQPFLTTSTANFFIKKSESLPNNLNYFQDKKIGFLDGWANDEKCLARYMKSKSISYTAPPPEKISDFVVHYETTKDLRDAIINGDVVAGFAGTEDMSGKSMDGLKKWPTTPNFKCADIGNGMMTRKDNTFNTYWNRGLAAIKSNGKFQQICKDAEKNHIDEGKVNCLLN